jgi:hypothetical protein
MPGSFRRKPIAVTAFARMETILSRSRPPYRFVEKLYCSGNGADCAESSAHQLLCKKKCNAFGSQTVRFSLRGKMREARRQPRLFRRSTRILQRVAKQAGKSFLPNKGVPSPSRGRGRVGMGYKASILKPIPMPGVPIPTFPLKGKKLHALRTSWCSNLRQKTFVYLLRWEI